MLADCTKYVTLGALVVPDDSAPLPIPLNPAMSRLRSPEIFFFSQPVCALFARGDKLKHNYQFRGSREMTIQKLILPNFGQLCLLYLLAINSCKDKE